MRKILILILALVFSVVSANAAVYYVSLTGTKNSGESTADDWTDENCYEATETNLQTLVDGLADGDEIIIDDCTISLSSNHIVSTNNTNTGTFTISSRNNDPTACVIQQTLSNKCIFVLNEATGVHTWIFNGLGLANNNSLLAYDGAAIWALGVTSDITLNNCRVYGFTNSTSSNTGPIFQMNSLTSGTRTLTLNDTTIEDIDITTGANACGLIGTAVDTLLVMDGCVVDDITVTIGDESYNSLGLFYCRNDLTVTNTTLSNITLSHVDAGSGYNYAIFYCPITTTTNTISGLTAYNIAQTGGHISGTIMEFLGSWAVSDSIAYNVTASENTSNGLGMFLVSFGDSADGTMSDCEVYDSTCQHGCVLYASQGGGATVLRLKAHGLTATGREATEPGGGAGVYAGGWGDVSISNSLFYGNMADEGADIYGHIHGDATRNKTTTIRNVTCYGGQATGGDSGLGGNSMVFKSGDETYYQTVNIYNVLAWPTASDDTIYGTNGTSLVLNVYDSDIRGGADAVTEEDTYTDNINTNPGGYNPPTSETVLSGGEYITGFHDTADGQRDANGNQIAPWMIPIGGVGKNWGDGSQRIGN